MRLCFLTASRANAFMNEILEALGAAVAEQGVPVEFATDRYPGFSDDCVYVLIPHEFFVCAPGAGAPTAGHLRRTVALCVEQPGTPWFEETFHWAQQLGGVADIRRPTVDALGRRGLSAVHVPLGYTERWDRWRGDEDASRPLDVLYLGSAEERRERHLAGYARTLAPRRYRLLVSSPEAKPQASPSFVLGEDKYELLRSATVLLNIHREQAEGLEWPRVLEAICNGCVVVTERSLDLAPLRAGEHVLAGRAESLGLLADRLLDDPDRLAAMRRDAYDFIRAELPMSRGAERLAELARDVVARPLGRQRTTRLILRPPPPADALRLEESVSPLRAALRRLVVEMGETRRELDELRDGMSPAPADTAPALLARTPAWAAEPPRVTVAIPLHNYAVEVLDALRSVAASEYEDYEILVLDDASTDRSVDAVREYLDARPWLPATLLSAARNAGLARTRNLLARQARTELLFVLDADNGLYPHGLRRLVEALDSDPEAAFAYPIIAVQERGRPVGLLSRHDWDPALLREHNPIDAMALLRRDALLDLGGYCEDPRLRLGWEDYDLWCQVAEHGGHGVHVPEILAWYRRTGHSLLAATNLDHSEMRSVIESRAPRLFSGSAPSRDR